MQWYRVVHDRSERARRFLLANARARDVGAGPGRRTATAATQWERNVHDDASVGQELLRELHDHVLARELEKVDVTRQLTQCVTRWKPTGLGVVATPVRRQD